MAFVTIDHPPINLFDRALMLDIHHVGEAIAADDDLRVIVFESANPELSPSRLASTNFAAFCLISDPAPRENTGRTRSLLHRRVASG